MSTTASRPETTDTHGTKHRHGCPANTFDTIPATHMRGWQFVGCTHCGAARLERDTRTTR